MSLTQFGQTVTSASFRYKGSFRVQIELNRLVQLRVTHRSKVGNITCQ